MFAENTDIVSAEYAVPGRSTAKQYCDVEKKLRDITYDELSAADSWGQCVEIGTGNDIDLSSVPALVGGNFK